MEEKERCVRFENKKINGKEIKNNDINSTVQKFNKNKNTFVVNTIENYKHKAQNENFIQINNEKNQDTNKAMQVQNEEEFTLNIKYVITLDADTNLSLNSGIELIEAMAHPLNKPVIDEEKKVVVDGYGIIQPRVGIELETSMKSIFTEIFAGDRRSRFIYKCYI